MGKYLKNFFFFFCNEDHKVREFRDYSLSKAESSPSIPGDFEQKREDDWLVGFFTLFPLLLIPFYNSYYVVSDSWLSVCSLLLVEVSQFDKDVPCLCLYTIAYVSCWQHCNECMLCRGSDHATVRKTDENGLI